LASLIKTGEMRWRLIKTRKMLGLVCQFQLDLSQDILWILSPLKARELLGILSMKSLTLKTKNKAFFQLSLKKILIQPDQWPLVELHM